MKKIKKILNNKKGVTLMECVVAIAILSIACWLTFGVFSNATSIVKRSKQQDADVSQTTAEMANYIGETTTNGDDTVTVSPTGGGGSTATIHGEWVTITADNGEETTIFVPYEAA